MGEQPSKAGKTIIFASISLLLILFELLRGVVFEAAPGWALAPEVWSSGQPVLAAMMLLVLISYATADHPALGYVGSLCAGLIYLIPAAAVSAYLLSASSFSQLTVPNLQLEVVGAPSFAGMFSAVTLVRLRKLQDEHTPFHVVQVYVVLFLALYSIFLRMTPWPHSVEGVAERGMSLLSAGLTLCVLAVRVPVLRRISMARDYGVEVALAAAFVLSLYWLAGGLMFDGKIEKVLTLGWFVLNSGTLWKLGAVADQNRRLLALKERQIAELDRKRQKLRVLTNSLSHDLRSPIRNARNLHQFREELSATGEPGLGDVDARLSQNLDRALALSETFVRYLSLGDAPVLIEDLDVRATLEPIAARFAGRVPVALGPLASEHIKAEREGFERIIENLIENAVKHNSNTPALEVRIDSEVWADGRYCLRICDTGIGIPEAFRERVFRPFETLLPKAQTGASGLGLAICQDLMARVGGAISLREGASGGACFELEFALAKEGAHVGSS